MEEKSCENCIHYLQHYVKYNMQLRTVFCGHCMKTKRCGSYREKDKICKLFSEKDLKKEKQEQVKSATKYLYLIAERMEELKEVLKDIE